MRVFVACYFSESVTSEFVRLQERLRRIDASALRLTNEHKLHLTLSFFGEISEETTESLAAGLEEIGSQRPAPTVRLSSVGMFPSSRRPRVVWVGLDEIVGSLRSLQSAIEARASELGLAREDREFTPHLTVARLRPRARLSERVVREIGELKVSPAESTIGEISLVQSILGAGGATHSVLSRFALHGA